MGINGVFALFFFAFRPCKVMLEVRSVGAIPVRERRGDPVIRFSTVIPNNIFAKKYTFLLRSHGDQWCQQSIPHPPPPPPQQTETQLQTQHQQHQINNRDSAAPMATRVVIKYEYYHKTTTLENNKNAFPFSIPGQQGLGCSVCRGPPSKPGVFVQSTKPGGLAREAGLRPGDQVGKDFTKK